MDENNSSDSTLNTENFDCSGQTNQLNQRKFWIDNLRWMTIILVVFFHVFYFYNNIGIDPIFSRLSPNPLTEGEKARFTFEGIFQYAVYQWFMLILFIISGICAKYTLQKTSVKQFLKARVQKLLVPSTLGIITVHWIGGWIMTSKFTADIEIPVPVKFIISVFSGTGGLWFCHVLIIACLVLALIKAIDRKNKLESLGEKSGIVAAIIFCPILVGCAQILNIKMIPTYRMCYYPVAFLGGYYIFSSEKLLSQLKKFWWLFLAAGIAGDVVYTIHFYGQYYSNHEVQNHWLSLVHAYFMVLGLIGAAQKFLDFNNKFTSYMSKASWGIFINHILLLIVVNHLLTPVAAELPLPVIYIIETVTGLLISTILWEALRRIPVIRYVLYGVKKCSKKTS